MKFKSFQEIPVWNDSHNSTILIYHISKQFPKDEIYGLCSQIRRSASSVPANIVEGFYRNSTKELIQFLYQARGSCGETIYHLILANDLEYLDKKEFENLVAKFNDIAKQLNNWINSLKSLKH